MIYPRAVGWLVSGRLGCKNGMAMLDGRRLAAPVIEDLQ
jgi:hypothetical protein